MWYEVKDVKPPVGKTVQTKIDDGLGERNIANLRFENNLWWSGNIYVYYTPTHWRFI